MSIEVWRLKKQRVVFGWGKCIERGGMALGVRADAAPQSPKLRKNLRYRGLNTYPIGLKRCGDCS
jgi:hypothetical protein